MTFTHPQVAAALTLNGKQLPMKVCMANLRKLDAECKAIQSQGYEAGLTVRSLHDEVRTMINWLI